MAASRIAGRYELKEQLGEGGMGIVWRALDIKTGSAVAIKLMKDVSDPVAVDLFAKEWKALAEISHPNIVEVRDVDVIEENRQRKPFFVMPLLRGATLADLIASASARLTLERIVEIATHVCRGLQAAHQRGLVHRDLKPSNIFVMDDDTAKIIDFGVVHLAGSKSITGQKGTFQYMSPEQAQLKEITPASDLFSMGVILYEALTRRKPFARKTVDETMDAVINYMPPPVSELYPSINQSVSKVVHKCLAKRPIHRFTSARELAETLQKAARNEPVFDSSKIEPRIERAKTAFKNGDEAFASEILGELESEGQLDPRITVLRMQIDVTIKQKKIRQLLESARARMEQDEIALALDKVREVLELDPQNAEAASMRDSIEKQRSEAQITKWMDLAETHLENRDFSAARHAVQEVLAIRRADTRALDLLEKIESTEADAKRIRDQKEQLYSSALRAYQEGEINSALSKLDRLFSVARANPNAMVPEREAVYQSFYKEVRSERDSVRSALEDAHRQFSEKNFLGAMAVCRQLLTKYPNDGTFQALKIRIEDAERQELSSYIAAVTKRLEEEPDLDRRVNIVREASERFPNETQFGQQLKLIRERRDLVNAIVAKARQLEERGQYAEAINQWDTLRNIHPQYSGIAFELEQCKKKRDRQAREEEHARLVEEIDGLMESRAYAKAIECAVAALRDFPNDAELSGLRTLAEQALERTRESRRLFEEGQDALAQKDLVRATELLRGSLNLDPRGPGLRDAVVNVLTERARTLADENWQEAEPLYEEACTLDSSHPAVRALRSSISEAKRQSVVGQCLTECRSLVAAGKAEEAVGRIRAARQDYPNDLRLEQFEATLLKEVKDVFQAAERVKDRVALGENRRMLEQNPNLEGLRDVLQHSIAIKAKYPDDAEIGQTVADIELKVKHAAKVDDLSELLRMETALSGTDGRVVGGKGNSSKAVLIEEKKGPILVGEKTRVFEIPEPRRREKKKGFAFVEAKVKAAELWRQGLLSLGPARKLLSARLLLLSAAFVLVAAIGYVVLRRVPGTPPPAKEAIVITTDPADSVVTSDGKAILDGKALAGTVIDVSHLGYKSKQIQLRQESDGKVTLVPEAVRLSIHTPEAQGSVELDGKRVADLIEGALDDYALPTDGASHKLTVAAQGRNIFAIAMQAAPAAQPKITTLEGEDLFVVTSLGNQATWYGDSQIKNPRIGDRRVALSPSGAGLTLSEQNHQLYFGQSKDEGSFAVEISNAPALAIQSLKAEGQVFIAANVDTAKLTVDGSLIPGKRRWMVRKPPGAHSFQLSADGYESQVWTLNMQRGRAPNKIVELVTKVSPIVPAAIFITGGTPGANVVIDGRNVGDLDSNGNLQVPKILNPGSHRVVFSKSGFELQTREIFVNPTAPGKVLADAMISSPVLSASRTPVVFQVNPKDAIVRYRRAGDAQYQVVSPGQNISLLPGDYEVMAEAAGHQRATKAITVGREALSVSVSLPAVPGYELADLNQIERQGEWFKAKEAGQLVYLKSGILSLGLYFQRPGKTLFWDKKKVEWQIEDPVHRARVQYVLDMGGKLVRKLIVGPETYSSVEARVEAQASARPGIVSIHIRLEGGRVRVTNDSGHVLDDFTAPGQDFSKSRIGMRTDSLFIVRSE